MIEIAGCPPVIDNGKPDISPEGIKKLEACLKEVPQTKDLNTDATGEYTDARKKLHKVIIGKLRAGIRCTVAPEKPIAIFTGGFPDLARLHFYANMPVICLRTRYLR